MLDENSFHGSLLNRMYGCGSNGMLVDPNLSNLTEHEQVSMNVNHGAIEDGSWLLHLVAIKIAPSLCV